MTRRRKYRRLKRWRKWMAAVHGSIKRGRKDEIENRIASFWGTEYFRVEDGWEYKIKVRLKNGPEIFQWSRFDKQPLLQTALSIYIFYTQEIINK